MHGSIFAELRKYVEVRLGVDKWPALLKEAGLESKHYLYSSEYPDAEAVSLVAAACKLTGKEISAILEDFGEFIVPALIKMYGALIKPKWRTLDVIEHTESLIHTAVRLNNPGARPPALRCTRLSPTEISVLYDSPRRMCALAVGIVRGIAKQYSERIDVRQDQCTYRGNAACDIRVLLRP